MNKITEKSCKTFLAEIYMAGDIHLAKQVIREYCLTGFCVSIEKVYYIYTTGEKSGFVARVINYPRFERTESEIKERASSLALSLLVGLHQGLCSIVFSDETVFMSRRDVDKVKQ